MTDAPAPVPTANDPDSEPDSEPDSDPDSAAGRGPTAPSPYGEPGPPLEHTPFYVGLLGGLGIFAAYWLATRLFQVSSVLILVLVALFLAAGLNPIVEYCIARGLKRSWALLVVI